MLDTAEQQSTFDELHVQAQMKRVVFGHMVQPEEFERREFQSFCRSAMVDCGPFVEQILELCELGKLAIVQSGGKGDRQAAQEALAELSVNAPPALEELVAVERDLALLGLGTLSMGQPSPGETVQHLQQEFRERAAELEKLPRAWFDTKFRVVEIFARALEGALLEVQERYVRDLELFKDGAAVKEGVAPEKVAWLQRIEASHTSRMERIDRVLNGVREHIRPCLTRLAVALWSETAEKQPPRSARV